MRSILRASFVSLLFALGACTPAEGPVSTNTMLDTSSHDVHFPIGAGSKHALGSDSPAISCNSCHGTADSFTQFDCLSCHQHSDPAPLAQAHRGLTGYAYSSASCYSCHKRGTAGTAPIGPVSDPAKSVSLTALVPAYSGFLISSLTPSQETLPMPMDHAAAHLDPAALSSCSNCHAGAAGGSFLPGLLHASLSALQLAQPTQCLDCHTTSVPAGFVGPLAAHPARTPASGEMKHDAVLWTNGHPGSAAASPGECALCHAGPANSGESWSTGRGGAAPVFHASLTAAGLPQPASCVDCHANTTPAGVLTSANAALPAKVQFDHGASGVAADCVVCHLSGATASQSTSWTGGEFHLLGAAPPAACAACHGGERPTSNAGWLSTTYQSAPFDYGGDASQNQTHGAGQECAVCHTGAGTGVFGGTPKQNWINGRFDHASASGAVASTCIVCHSSQRPDLQPPGSLPADMVARLAGFNHATAGIGDCIGCHQATVAAGSYANYDGDWKGAGAPTGLSSDPSQAIVVAALIPAYSGVSISSLSPQSEALPMQMNHAATSVPAAAFSACSNCHVNAAAGAFFPGLLHESLSNLSLAQPTQCLECHSTSAPIGFVGPLATHPARTPPSGEMKHDAVLWSAGHPITASASPAECALCHISPSINSGTTWASGRAGATLPVFHASLTAAAKAQPSSCLDCHANSIPSGVLTSANAALPANVQFDHAAPAAVAECATCHTSGAAASSFSAWSGGEFHLPGSSTPASCLPCHTGERPTSIATWTSTTFRSAPFDYVTNAQSVSHGAGQDCAVCHASPGTGNWGGTPKQNWVNGAFVHSSTSGASSSSCIVCHSTQRPDLQAPGSLPSDMVARLNGFDHASNGTGDCFGCHQQTVVANSYSAYDGDWKGGALYPGATPVSSSSANVTVTELILARAPSTNLVTGFTQTSATLHGDMIHVSAAIPAQVSPGPANNPDDNTCWHCHTHAAGSTVITSYAEGRFHTSLDNYSATPGGTIAPLAQPTVCLDCHAQMRPSGIVELNGAELQPMDHAAMFTAPATIGGITASGAGSLECASCHKNAGGSWNDGAFHKNIGSARPADCTVCHYPLMADAAASDVTQGVNYKMKHASGQVTFQACQTCHTGALSASTTTPIAAALWRPGALHASVSAQPSTCLDCHTVSAPAANASTQSNTTYTFANGGGTTTNRGQWMNHGASDVVNKDCAVCHASDAKATGSAWSKSVTYHTSITTPANCQNCHGTGNGHGATPGTNNNLPAGLSSSSMLTTASNDASTGIPAGTHDQVNHADVNASGHDCNFCHTQTGPSTTPGVQGSEWAKATFHAQFASTPMVLGATTGRCSNCHMNVKPGSGFGTNHSTFTNVSGSEDCASCHTYPGTGTFAQANWLGAVGVPATINTGGFVIPVPPAASAGTVQAGIANLPHPSVTGTACTTCHTSNGGGKNALGYDHASTLGKTNCNACHEAGSDLVGTVWNGATSQTSGLGDTRPFTLTSLSLNDCNLKTPGPHFYSSDCSVCHKAPAGIAVAATTATALKTAWAFTHPSKSGSSSVMPCSVCHVTNNCGN